MHDAIDGAWQGLLQVGILPKQQDIAEACSDRPIGYNPIRVATGRSAQPTESSSNDAQISIHPCGGRLTRSRCRRFLDRALPYRSDSQLGPRSAHSASKNCTPFGPAYFRARATRAEIALAARRRT